MSLVVNVVAMVSDGGGVTYVQVGRMESVLPVNEDPENVQGQLDHVDLTRACLERLVQDVSQEADRQTSQLRELLARHG